MLVGAAGGPTLKLQAVRPAAKGPTQLQDILRAQARAVDLLGRETALADLDRWLDADRTISVRVLVGPGGAGKTRLALELCAQRTAKGWNAGFLGDGELTRFVAHQNLGQWSWPKPTLVVIDYATARADRIHGWLRELVYNDGVEGAPLRLLLLDRDSASGDAFRQRAFGHGDSTDELIAQLLDPPAPVALQPLDSIDTCIEVYVETLRAAGQAAPSASVRNEVEGYLRSAPWAREPLFLMMAALVSLEHGLSTTLGWSRAELAHAIAKRELARIRKHAKERQADEDVVAQLAACITLRQGVEVDALPELVTSEAVAGGFGAVVAHRYVGLLKEALGCERDRVEGVRPDFVGEALSLQALGTLDTATSAKASAKVVLRQVQADADRVIESIIRACQDFGHERAGEPAPRALVWFDVVLKEADRSRLQLLASLLPQQTLALRERAVVVTEKLLEPLRTQPREQLGEEKLAELAAGLHNLGSRLGALGQREAALEAARESVDTYRTLAKARPETFLPDLAMSLNNLGGDLGALGQREAALEATRESVEIRRTQAKARPDAFLPGLAASLDNLGSRLRDVGRREAALEATREAVDTYRTLAKARPDAFLPDLAMSLNNLGGRLSNLGHREAALEATREAVDICRALAKARPDAFLPDLATSLNNLGVLLSALGEREAALEAARESVDTYRTLAKARPDAFLPDLATSLDNLGIRLGDVGHREAALEAVREAVDIRRSLAKARPEVFLPDLATSLKNLGNRLSALGQREAALEATREATEIQSGREARSKTP